MTKIFLPVALLTAYLFSCNNVVKQTASNDQLPKPFATKSVLNFAQVIGWPTAQTPSVPNGFIISKFADSLDNPRRIYQAPNGDIFVAEATIDTTVLKNFLSTFDSKYQSMHFGSSANRVTMFRDADGDGHYEERHVFLEGLDQPFGMLVLNNSFYVANTDGILQFPYRTGDTALHSPGKKIMSLPAGGYNNHWTRNLIANREGTKLFVSIGSGTNIAEHGLEVEKGRACILSANPDGSGEAIYADGLRNPVGMGWAPGTNTLWTAVNERDELGDDLVPDYFTHVQPNGFYGWPFTYWGNHADPRVKEQNTHDADATIVPDVSLGAHTASLGLAFDEHNLLPGKYRGGVLIAQHGSWNRSTLSGYRIVFIPFSNGKPQGPPETFADGFLAGQDPPKAYGRPVDVLVTSKGKVLITDDAANRIWCIQPKK